MLQNEQRRSESKDAEISRLLGLLSNAARDNAALREDVSALVESHESDRAEMSRLRQCIEELQKSLVEAVNQTPSQTFPSTHHSSFITHH